MEKQYTQEQFNAQQAQNMAHIYSWGPVVFQVARLMRKYGIFTLLSESVDGLKAEEIVEKTHLSGYAVKCLLEASLTMHTVLIDKVTCRYKLAKTGWFLLNDPLINVNINFNHEIGVKVW